MAPISRLLAVLVAVVVLAAAVGCARRDPGRSETQATARTAPAPPPPAPPASPTPKLGVVQKQVTLRWIEKGKLRMSGTASQFRGNEVTRIGELIDFSGKLYENGKLTAQIAAPRAVADTGKRIVTATGGVTMRSVERSTVVRAAWVKWFERANKVVGDGGVKIESTTGTVEAAAFVADTALKTLTVKDSAKGLY